MPAQRIRDTNYSLEVTTDGLQAPSVSIISPTPRAFTFPINDNASPFSSPSSSPFEPDLRTLAITTCTTPPTFITTSPTISTVPTIEPPSPPMTTMTTTTTTTTTPKRRKSTCSSDLERRPRKGDEDYVKRPENAFILFRRKCCEERQQQAQVEAADGPGKKQRQADLSKTISQQWKNLSPEERQYWEELAKEKKKEHEQMYPNYVYRPQRSKDKDGRLKNKKAKGIRGEYEHDTDSESLSFVLPFPTTPYTRRHGRSASAPTPPIPYQSIQLPNVYMPSCPTSPSILPLIRRRSAHPNYQGPMAPFEYFSSNFISPFSGRAGGIEASLQPSELSPDMYTTGQSASRGITPLQALSVIPNQSSLLQAHPLVSPSSSIGTGCSSPSSPVSGPASPYTPIPATLGASYPQFCGPEFAQMAESFFPGPQGQTEEQLQAELQLQQDLYASFSWENNSIWPSGGEMLLGEDFDLNAIPPIELGLPKYGEDLNLTPTTTSQIPAEFGNNFIHGLDMTQFHDENQNIDGLLFDDMMHGF